MHKQARNTARALIALTASTFATLATADTAHAQDEIGTSPSVGLTLPDRSLATQDDAASLEVNPAGLGFMNTGEFQYNLLLGTPDYAGTVDSGHALFMAAGARGLGVGFGAQFLNSPTLGGAAVGNSYRKFTVGGAIGDGRKISLGVNYNYFGSTTSRTIDELHAWDLGAQLRLSPNIGMGFFARDINRPFLTETASFPTRWGAALALRFLDGRIVLDQSLEKVQDSDSITLTPRVVLEVLNGLRIFARANFDVTTTQAAGTSGLTDMSAGLEMSLGAAGAQAAFFAKRDNGTQLTGHGYTVWVAPDKKRSLLNPSRKWVLMDLTKGYSELPASGLFSPSAESFSSLIFQLDRIAADKTIDGVVFNISSPGLGYAQIWEVRQRIDAIRAAGKNTVAVMQAGGTRDVMLASASDKVWMVPTTVYEPVGISATIQNYAEALSNLGVKAEFFRVRDYKSSPEAYIKRAPSEEAKQQLDEYIDLIFAGLKSTIVLGRKLDPAKLAAVIDAPPLLPDEALDQGYIDAIVYPDEVEELLKAEFKRSISLQKGYKERPTSEETWNSRAEVAVLVIDGAIVQGGSGASPLGGDGLSGSDTIIGAINKLRGDGNVKAVVVRIDSPGGSALASDQIYRELRRLAQKKPVIASMGNIAASGGYYIAAGADEIIASPWTLTGSIGIFAGKFSLGEFSEKWGINTTMLQRGEAAGAFSMWTPFSDKQKAYIKKYILYLYEMFLVQVTNTRDLTVAELDAVARGRVWSGEAAMKKKLVDRQGGLLDALRRAEELAKLEEREAIYRVYPNTSSPISSSPGLSTAVHTLREAITPDLPGEIDTFVRLAAPMQRMLDDIGPMVLMPLLYEDGEALMLPMIAIDID